MAYNKLYTKTTWNNDNRPAINADNLNHIEKGIDDIDSRVVEIGNDVSDVKSGLKDLAYGEVAGGANLYNENELVKNGLVFSNGFKYYNGADSIVLPCKSEDKFTVSGLQGGIVRYCFVTGGYNGEKEVYSGFSATVTGYYESLNYTNPSFTVTVPSNAKYFALYIGNKDTLQIEFGSVATDYHEWIPSVKTIANDVSTLNNSLNDLAYSTKTGVTKNLTDVNTFSNSVTDSQTTFFYHFRAMNGTTRVALEQGTVSANGTYHCTLNLTDKTFDSIQLKHNGSTRDIPVISVATSEKGYYTISFNCNGFNPSSVGGLKLDNIMLEKNDHATDFVPYIAQSVKSLNDSLNAQGLLNKFDGNLGQGYINTSTKTVVNSPNWLHSNTLISVNVGDKITAKFNDVIRTFTFIYNNSDGSMSSSDDFYNKNEFDIVIPSGVKSIQFNFNINNSAITPSTAPKFMVYVNNAIESLKADLQNAGGGGSNYSTTETVIGKWIDGRNIYRKTFVTNNYSVVANSRQYIDLLGSVDFIINQSGYVRGKTNDYLEQDVRLNIPFYFYSGDFGAYELECKAFVSSNDTMKLFVMWNTGATLNIAVTVEYVKK